MPEKQTREDEWPGSITVGSKIFYLAGPQFHHRQECETDYIWQEEML